LCFEFNYRVLSERLRIKTFAEAKTLDDQGRHLALEMPISRMAHTERERERAHLQNNIKAKPEQLKLNKTYPSMWL
jgi:DNA invertase Pin-like site-specific DNA recombinase